ncbi:Acetyltransferase (GNAT) family protein [Vibrio ruber DSM 16370]|uniref:Acetyltransferase (GNAT) family protein n=1 Tax=Vibrio ruber (strain DSM 16370 / JCM 11486 / BCRC 17186 / CECT 7878 / LMG 23124 / VR1) TaxID=1123498 RepID=A0A1R4LQA7_VIBR1|nr:GNAT family N-acetyltransferase [Vibrio ruber]SJN58464.1 Acetyltransferase (GNAT) family protein [Vibrio ruber DSM 16370]
MDHLSFEMLDPLKLPLVQRFYKQHYPTAKPKRNELIYTAHIAGQLCAVVRFRHIGTSYLLLTGMAVAKELRAQGIGHQLLSYCEAYVLKQHVFCFAYRHLENFYHQHHFERQSPQTLPVEINHLYQRYCNQGRDILPMQYSPPFQQ